MISFQYPSRLEIRKWSWKVEITKEVDDRRILAEDDELGLQALNK